MLNICYNCEIKEGDGHGLLKTKVVNTKQANLWKQSKVNIQDAAIKWKYFFHDGPVLSAAIIMLDKNQKNEYYRYI